MLEKLKKKRMEKHYTLTDLAKVIEKSPSIYQRKENGLVKFSVTEALRIADFMDEKVEELFFEEWFSETERRS